MNKVTCILCLTITASTAHCDDITLKNGVVLKDATLTARDSTTASITHEDGVLRVPIAQLPSDTQKQLGINANPIFDANWNACIVVEVFPDRIRIWRGNSELNLLAADLPDRIRAQYLDPILFVLPTPFSTQNGTELVAPSINSFDREGVTVAHASGMLRISHSQLPLALRLRMPFTDDTRLAYKIEYARRIASASAPADPYGFSIPGLDFGYSLGGLRSAFSGGSVHVNGYTRSDGIYVRSHTRTAPDGIRSNNYSTSHSGRK